MFTCLGALAILDRVEEVDAETLAWWLAERQLPNGGLNGRPEKLEDVSVSIVYSSVRVCTRTCGVCREGCSALRMERRDDNWKSNRHPQPNIITLPSHRLDVEVRLTVSQ